MVFRFNRIKRKKTSEWMSFLVGEAGLEPARPQ